MGTTSRIFGVNQLLIVTHNLAILRILIFNALINFFFFFIISCHCFFFKRNWMVPSVTYFFKNLNATWRKKFSSWKSSWKHLKSSNFKLLKGSPCNSIFSTLTSLQEVYLYAFCWYIKRKWIKFLISKLKVRHLI